MSIRRPFLLAAILSAGAAAVAQPPLPPPLGPVPVPAGNPITTAKANLGKALFWDEQLSATGTVSCGTCHIPSRGGSDPRSLRTAPNAVNPGLDADFGTADDAIGSPGVPYGNSVGTYEWQSIFGYDAQVTRRKSRTFINAAYAQELFWDGRAPGEFRDPVTDAVVLNVAAALESQAAGPVVDTGEMSHIGRSWTEVADSIAAAKPLALSPTVPADLANWIAGRSYPELFQEAFGTSDVTPSRAIMAIATYERTTISNQTPFDQLLAGNNTALTAQEMRGLNVFVGSRCAQCHAGSLMSDNQYHFIGVRPSAEDLGRFNETNNNNDRGAFRTPHLRNIELRAPYMHGGQFATLEEVVDFYNRGGDFREAQIDPRIAPLNLNAGQRADLLAFLRRPLTDPRVAAGTAPFDRPTLYTESDRVPVVIAGGIPGFGGTVPRPMAIEPPILGNPSFTVAVTEARGSAAAILAIGDADPGTGAPPASASLARIETTTWEDGYASLSITLPNDAALRGRTYFGRWYIADPEADGGYAVSSAFRFTMFGDGIESAQGFTGFTVF